MADSYDINNKVAFITGGVGGIGTAIARELLKNGAKGIGLADVNETKGEELVKQLEGEFSDRKVIFVKTDVTKTEELKEAFKKVFDTFGYIDIVANNAGVMNDAQWELEIAINCNHVVTGSLLALQYLGKNNGGKGGVVINVSSILGLQPLDGCPIYVGTKHFVRGFTSSLSTPFYADLTGIRFLILCPGVTDTPLISEAGKFALHALHGVPNLGKLLADELASLPAQKTEFVGKAVVKMLTEGANGSIWVSEGGEPAYEVKIPDRLTLKVPTS